MLGMGTLSTKKRSESGADGAGTGDGDDVPFSGPWLSPNGDGGGGEQHGQHGGTVEVTVEAEDTLFLRELRVKAKVGG